MRSDTRSEREAIGHVIRVSRGQIVVNIETDFQTRVFAHTRGIARVGQPGDVLGSAAGDGIIVLLITELAFSEQTPFQASKDTSGEDAPPLQQFITRPLGFLSEGSKKKVLFEPGVLQTPFLGAAVFPLSDDEIAATTRPVVLSSALYIGQEARDKSRAVTTDLDTLLGRHAAVVGSTGQGKTHFVVNRLKEILKLPHSRIVVFDINGEYSAAFPSATGAKYTKFESSASGDTRIPYIALGGRGLIRLLIPSERTQLPALRLAIDSLSYVECTGTGTRLAGTSVFNIFDDCRSASQTEMAGAYAAIEKLRGDKTGLTKASTWPNMRALSCIAADSIALLPKGNMFERNAFQYGNVTSLVNRIRNCCSDSRFTSVVNIHPGTSLTPLQPRAEVRSLLRSVFGDPDKRETWKINIVDLSNVAVDHLGYILGAILEQFADEIFERGPGQSEPALLVLEEAHHYLRSVKQEAYEVAPPMAYDRLAKEGRKYGVSMLLSTQRPSELSETVLSQCGTLFAFRLTNEHDKAIVNAASDINSFLFQDLSMLQRGEFVAAGAGFNFPIRVLSSMAEPPPKSADYEYARLWSTQRDG